MDTFALPISAALGYLLGSIPFGLLLTRLAGLGDIRAIGSGNIGATNVLRTGRKDIALATLLLDGGKAAIALLIARSVFGFEAGLLAGGMAFVGHCFPVWLGFKGGKGVATFFGVLFAGLWPVGLTALQSPPEAILFCAGLAVLIFWRHKENIGRLLAGTEPKIGQKKAAPAAPAPEEPVA